jgi:hypothetical protein
MAKLRGTRQFVARLAAQPANFKTIVNAAASPQV